MEKLEISNAKAKDLSRMVMQDIKIGAIINIKEFVADKKGNIWGRTNQLMVMCSR